MPSPSVWGPPIWTLFHTLAEKIKEEDFNQLSPVLFHYIKRISAYLPCPECSQHATKFFESVKPVQIANKTNFINMLFFFHNSVNTRRQKKTFQISEIEKYKKNNIISVYNQFINVYNTKGNMQMLSESFQRQMIVKEFKKWFTENIHSFQ